MTERKKGGNPNPNHATRFKPGQSGNPGGKKKGQRQAEIDAAELASQASLKMMESLMDVLDSEEKPEAVLMHIRSETLRLMKDVQDRAHGTPKQTVGVVEVSDSAPTSLDDWYAGFSGDDDLDD